MTEEIVDINLGEDYLPSAEEITPEDKEKAEKVIQEMIQAEKPEQPTAFDIKKVKIEPKKPTALIYGLSLFIVFVGIFAILKFFVKSSLMISGFLGALGTLIFLGIMFFVWGRHQPIKVIKPKKETTFHKHELANIKYCRECGSRLKKSKIEKTENGYIQYIKCPSFTCDFREKIELNN